MEVPLDRAAASHRFLLFGPLIGVGILQASFGMLYAWLRTDPPEGARWILAFSTALLVVYWIVADARGRRCVPCFDFGYLLAISLPFSLIWYAFWTRGWRGILRLLAIVGAIYGPWLCATILWVLLHSPTETTSVDAGHGKGTSGVMQGTPCPSFPAVGLARLDPPYTCDPTEEMAS
jgi:hypothetical protein